MITLKKAGVVLVFNRNRILVKTDKEWIFYTPTLLDPERVIEELMAELKKEFSQKIKNIETGFSFLVVGPTNEHIVFSNRAANNELTINNFEIGIFQF